MLHLPSGPSPKTHSGGTHGHTPLPSAGGWELVCSDTLCAVTGRAGIPVLHESLFAEFSCLYVIITSVSVQLEVTILLVYSVNRSQSPLSGCLGAKSNLHSSLALMFGVEPQLCSPKPSKIEFLLVVPAAPLGQTSVYPWGAPERCRQSGRSQCRSGRVRAAPAQPARGTPTRPGGV